MSSLIRAHIAYSNAVLAIGKEHEKAINEIAKKIKIASEAGHTMVQIPLSESSDAINFYLAHFGYRLYACTDKLTVDWSAPIKPC